MDGAIQEGLMCTMQGIVMQIGNVATAFFTASIAIHTFNSLVLRNRHSTWMGVLVILTGWIATSIITTAPLLVQQPLGPLYGISALSCGVSRVYPQQQFLFQLLPIFLASFVSVILYSLIFLVLRGTLVLNGSLKVNLDPHQRWNGRIGNSKEYYQFMNAIAKSMLWYPFAYILLLLPFSVTRMADLSGFKVSPGANAFASSCMYLLGLVNVLLLYNTVRVIGPACDAMSAFSGTRDPDMESFSCSESDSPSMIEKQSRRSDLSPFRRQGSTPHPPGRHASTLNQGSSSAGGRSSAYNPTINIDDLVPLQHSTSPTSELNYKLKPLTLPEMALKKGVTEAPRLRLQISNLHAESTRARMASPAGSSASSSPVGLPPPPRWTRAPIARMPTLESLPPSTHLQRTGLSPSAQVPGHAGRFSPISVYGNHTSGNTMRDSFGTRIQPAFSSTGKPNENMTFAFPIHRTVTPLSTSRVPSLSSDATV